MRANKLRLNPDKTEVLLVSHNANQGTEIQPELDGSTLSMKSQVHSMGVLLDSTLSLNVQVSVVAKNAFAVRTGVPAVPIPGGISFGYGDRCLSYNLSRLL